MTTKKREQADKARPDRHSDRKVRDPMTITEHSYQQGGWHDDRRTGRDLWIEQIDLGVGRTVPEPERNVLRDTRDQRIVVQDRRTDDLTNVVTRKREKEDKRDDCSPSRRRHATAAIVRLQIHVSKNPKPCHRVSSE